MTPACPTSTNSFCLHTSPTSSVPLNNSLFVCVMNKAEEHKWSHFPPTCFRSFLFLATSISPAVHKGELEREVGGGNSTQDTGEVRFERDKTKYRMGGGGGTDGLVLFLFTHIPFDSHQELMLVSPLGQTICSPKEVSSASCN